MNSQVVETADRAIGCAGDLELSAIDLVVQSLPPEHDAIGEYTFCLANELSTKTGVRVLTSHKAGDPCDETFSIDRCFELSGRDRLRGLSERLHATNSDAVILQYNPFAWGRRGWAPDLVRLMADFQRERADCLLAVMFHETFMMNPGLRSWVMRQYQRKQFNSLCSMADVCFFSTETWCKELRREMPGRQAFHLPVGANLPRSKADGRTTRQQWAIGEDDFVCGVFGGAHPSRMLDWIESASQQIAGLCGRRPVVLLHVGGEGVDWTVPGVRVVRTGRLPAADASDAIAAMDLMINPFTDGISTRRGSAMAALQNGVPVLTTSGHATDSIWESLDGHAVFLSAPDSEESWSRAIQRAWSHVVDLDREGREQVMDVYQNHFSWPVIADLILRRLTGVTQS